jgi:hypothetical protein
MGVFSWVPTCSNNFNKHYLKEYSGGIWLAKLSIQHFLPAGHGSGKALRYSKKINARCGVPIVWRLLSQPINLQFMPTGFCSQKQELIPPVRGDIQLTRESRTRSSA